MNLRAFQPTWQRAGRLECAERPRERWVDVHADRAVAKASRPCALMCV